MKILIVEDETVNAMLLRHELKEASLSDTSHACTGEAALEQAQNVMPDMVLMDINLGDGIDGIEAAARIQKLGKPGLVFLTGYDDAETRSRAEALKPLAYLIKPVSMGKVAALLREWIQLN